MTRSEFANQIISQVQMNPEGFFKYDRNDEQVEYQGQVYKYYSSGLLKNIYISPDRKTVLKFPENHDIDNVALLHVICEAEAWDLASEEERKYLAETHYVSELGCTIQEFVEVVKNEGKLAEADARELGVTADGRTVIFDCDPICDQFDKPYNGYKYNFAKRIIQSHLDNQK